MSTWREDATKLLSKYGRVRDHSTRDFGREPHTDAVAVVIRGGGAMVEDVAVAKLREVRARLPPGTVAWLGTTRWLGDEKFEGMVELAIGEGTTQFDILRHAASDGINHGLETKDLVEQLTKWHRTHGIDVFHAESDTIELELLHEPPDRLAFAKELYAFCPDIVEQGVGSVEALATALEVQHVYLWWD